MKKLAVILFMFFFVDSSFAINWGKVTKSVGKSIEKHSAKEAGFKGASHHFEQGAAHNAHNFDPSSTNPDLYLNPGLYHGVRKIINEYDSTEKRDLRLEKNLFVPSNLSNTLQEETKYRRRFDVGRDRIDFDKNPTVLPSSDALNWKMEKNHIRTGRNERRLTKLEQEKRISFINRLYYVDFLPVSKKRKYNRDFLF